MTKKIFAILLILLLGAVCVTAGYFILDRPGKTDAEAVQQPGVTKTEGRVFSTTSRTKIVEGKITKLTDKKMFLSIQDVEWELILPENVRNEIKILNEKGIEIKKGTFVNVQYQVENDQRIATKVMRLVSN